MTQPHRRASSRQIRMRTCIATRKKKPDTQLLRLVFDADSLLVVPDPERKLPGRGAWITPSSEALQTALQRRAIERALKVSTPVDTVQVKQWLETTLTRGSPPKTTSEE